MMICKYMHVYLYTQLNRAKMDTFMYTNDLRINMDSFDHRLDLLYIVIYIPIYTHLL